jgi:hypothetical protein
MRRIDELSWPRKQTSFAFLSAVSPPFQTKTKQNSNSIHKLYRILRVDERIAANLRFSSASNLNIS